MEEIWNPSGEREGKEKEEEKDRLPPFPSEEKSGPMGSAVTFFRLNTDTQAFMYQYNMGQMKKKMKEDGGNINNESKIKIK